MSTRSALDAATKAAIAASVARQRKRFKASDFDQAVLLMRAYRRINAERAQRQENAA